MPTRKPLRPSPDEVRITREGETAIIEHADPSFPVVHLAVGPGLGSMTDAAVLDLLDAVSAAQEKLAAAHDGTVIEIPPGRPQIRHDAGSGQWVPRGGVLRCRIGDDEAGELVVDIDGRQLSLRDFGRLLTTHAGWGMRIAFVPEDRIDEQPVIVAGEPEEGEE